MHIIKETLYMLPIKKVKSWLNDDELVKWRYFDYHNSIDCYFENMIAKKTNLKREYIIIWFAKRNKRTKEFDTFYFQYLGNYYALKKDKIKKITRNDIFK